MSLLFVKSFLWIFCFVKIISQTGNNARPQTAWRDVFFSFLRATIEQPVFNVFLDSVEPQQKLCRRQESPALFGL